MKKQVHIPIGCDKQGRLRPTFLDRPQAHTTTERDSKSPIDYACALEAYERADDMVWLLDLFLAALLVTAVVCLVAGFI